MEAKKRWRQKKAKKHILSEVMRNRAEESGNTTESPGNKGTGLMRLISATSSIQLPIVVVVMPKHGSCLLYFIHTQSATKLS
jgi:hypothetical protein